MAIADQNISIFSALISCRNGQGPGINSLEDRFIDYCAENFRMSHAQLFQDLLALFCLDNKREGYFVEFGATNGIELSNTYLLEKRFGWHGILAEPARCWHADLATNRTAIVDKRCIWSSTGDQLEFKETKAAELSTLLRLTDKDFHKHNREDGEVYNVETISLVDLLELHNSPEELDYMSIDTEGSELTILRKFDFERYSVNVITVEHNHTSDRNELRLLLEGNHYVNIFPLISQFDDWYVHKRILEKISPDLI